jgi:hypothetical protein
MMVVNGIIIGVMMTADAKTTADPAVKAGVTNHETTDAATTKIVHGPQTMIPLYLRDPKISPKPKLKLALKLKQNQEPIKNRVFKT